uniref:Uncharacterized protein n=1 Tax=Pristionchus pacificus TaxID=54126 RepID=A0A2A6CHH2_PRIPA|eukprot:PDM77513.1 hypothetical protein PRIPAC_34380 [Pristionchus pacificus]
MSLPQAKAMNHRLNGASQDVRSWKVIKDQSSNLDVASLPRSFEAGLHSQIVLARSKVISKLFDFATS